MKRWTLLIWFFCCAFAAAAQAEQLFYGNLNIPNSITPRDRGNVGLDATYRWNKDTGFTIGKAGMRVYGMVFLQRDSDRNSYNGKSVFSVGAELTRKIGNHTNLSYGMRYDSEYRDISGESFAGLVATADVSYYKRRDLPDGSAVVKTGWSNLRSPGGLDKSNRMNTIWQGRFDWSRVFAKPWIGGRIERFGAVQFGADVLGDNANNKFQVHAGLRSRWKLRDRVDVAVSVGVVADNHPVSGLTTIAPTASVGWFTRF